MARLVRLPMPAPSEPRILTVDEARELLNATRDDRLVAALVLLVVLGLRRSEALGLRCVDVDLDVGVLHARQRLHWFRGLTAVPAAQDDGLGGRCRSLASASTRCVPKVRLHDLRHICVSLLLTLGVNPRVVMEIVGHSALEMTMNVYGHVAVDQQREALDKLDGLFDR